jgi:glycosyltransferase involved in cell wall biosynthesis
MKAACGGLSIQVTNTALALERKGVHVTFYNPWEACDWENIDLAHIFRADLETYTIAQWLHETGIPFVTTPVFYNSHSFYKIRVSLALSRIARNMLSGIRSDLDCVHDICQWSIRVLPNTYAEKTFLEKGIGATSKKVIVIPNAVEERFAQADPSLFVNKHGIKDFILSVGNFGYPRKNMLNLIHALGQIDHPAVLIGSIYDNAYGRQCRKELETLKNILWLDALPHDDPMLASAYAACKVFVLPSYFETPGIAAMEAALSGANIVITPHGGPKEYFRNMADYVDPDSISSIKDKITTLLLKEPGPHLKKHILDTYTYSNVAEKLVQIYKEIKS